MTGFEAFGKITSISDVYIEEAAFENESAPGVLLMPRRGILSGIASFFGSAAGVAIICGVISIGMIMGISILGRGSDHNDPASTVDVTTTDVQDTESDAETETETESETAIETETESETETEAGEPEIIEPETKPCTHLAGEWIVDTPANIGVEGSRHKECTLCGDLLEVETLEALIPSEGLEFTSKTDGTCYVSGIGTCKDTDIVIPLTSPEGRSVTIIGASAFRECNKLTSVVIPNSVTTIGENAFYDCTRLTSVTIGDSVTTIEARAFYWCNGLTSVTIGDRVSIIGEYAFQYCTMLTSITIPDHVTTIRSGAFASCVDLTSITLPDSVAWIGDSAFSSCLSLTSVVIPDSVTRIGPRSFQYCTGLTSVTIGKNVTSIGEDAFFECPKLIEVINKSNLNIKTGTSAYGRVAYYAEEVHDGESKIVNVDGYLFYTLYGTHYLLGTTANVRLATTLVLPDDFNGEKYAIYKYAFSRCIELTSLTIGKNVTSIGYHAFESSDHLTDVYFTGTEEEWAAISLGCFFIPTIHYNYVP